MEASSGVPLAHPLAGWEEPQHPELCNTQTFQTALGPSKPKERIVCRGSGRVWAGRLFACLFAAPDPRWAGVGTCRNFTAPGVTSTSALLPENSSWHATQHGWRSKWMSKWMSRNRTTEWSRGRTWVTTERLRPRSTSRARRKTKGNGVGFDVQSWK